MSEEPTGLPEFIKLLANEVRWKIVTALATGDYRVFELVELTGQPMNLVSYHLKQLRDDSLVLTRRSDADGRDVYYSLDLDRIRERYLQAGMALHPSLVGDFRPGSGRENRNLMGKSLAPGVTTRVLILCTHNSARSQMAEGIMRYYASEHLEVHSAGSHPTTLRQEAIDVLREMGIDISHQQVKHIEEYVGQEFHYVITVCDLAREVCPHFPGGQQLHWGLSDPTRVVDPDERRAAFVQTAERLKSRIKYFLETLPT